MRPIWMKIKGLNSFLETQEIDFKRLTSQGLFGIFGPTGSGKSSILDGITLALYGTTARNSGNFIHVATDRASVEYIFSVQEKEVKTYRVSRSFKRSKEGGIRSDGARISSLLGEEENILADRVGGVNEKCREIIGLSKEDFFRTVVLPQGKFSEFLRLEGMERNKMMERLFHLEKYGENLVSLIKREEELWKGKKAQQEGALSQYKTVDREQGKMLKQKEKEYKEKAREQNYTLELERKKLEERQRQLKEQEEFQRLQREEEKLEAERQEIQSLEKELEKAETAGLLWDFLQEFSKARESEKESREKYGQALQVWQEKNNALALLKQEKEKQETRSRERLPKIQEEQARLQESQELFQNKEKQEKAYREKKAQSQALGEEISSDKNKLTGLEEKIQEFLLVKDAQENRIKELTVPLSLQQGIQEGLRRQDKLEESKSREKEAKEKWQQLLELKKEAETSVEKAVGAEKKAREERLGLREKRQQAETEYRADIASWLAKDLEEGEPCPVCGSIHHQKPAHISGKKQTDFQEYIKGLEEQENQAQEKWEETQKQSLYWEGQRKNLQAQAQEREKEYIRCREERESLEKAWRETAQRLQIQDFRIAEQEVQQKLKQKEELQDILNRTRDGLEKRRDNRERGIALIQEKTAEKAKLDGLLLQLLENIRSQEMQLTEKVRTLEYFQGQEMTLEHFKEYQSALEKEKRTLEKAEKELAEKWDTFTREEETWRQEKTLWEGRMLSWGEEMQKKQKLLQDKMKEYQVEEEDWILAFRKEKQEIKQGRERIQSFRDKLLQLKTQTDSVKKNLKDSPVTRQQVEETKDKVRELEEGIQESSRQLGAVKKQLEQLDTALLEKEKLEKELTLTDHRLDLLLELDNLFKGKRFVEYVARYYLEYVSREADERLREMTGSSYGLETDGSGMFIIRDYKNGGVSRPASTLSGGETFMASLALALALSSQIQMKGAAPLELFFLDEGFGTLDGQALEVVMECLERIRNKRRSVGVISHVEEIKSRIPVRLLVNPAQMGEGGSKIQIEEE